VGIAEMREIWARHLMRSLPEPTPAFVAAWERKVARALQIWQRASAEEAMWPYPARAAVKARRAYQLLQDLFRQRDAIVGR
jgi:hypothetical protein